MTDDTGMLQHATFTIPNYREGYSIPDDNARALIVSTLLEELGSGEAFKLASRYLAFIGYAFNTESGRFRNFMDYQRHWLEKNGSDDSHGRHLWALGTVLGRSNTRASRVWPAGSSSRPCRPFSRPPAPGPGPSPSLVSMSISGGLKGTAGPTRFGMNWPVDCSPHIKTAARMNGAGMKPG